MITFDRNNLIRSLENNWGNKPCPMCGHNQWIVAEEMYTPILVDKNGSMNIGSKILPLIPVVCNHCGNTILVNGKLIGCVEESIDVKDGHENV